MASVSTTDARPLRLDMPAETSMQVTSASDVEDSSRDDAHEDAILQEEDAQSTIGVSMSHAHARLISTKTPAVEKAAMLESLEGGGLFDGTAVSRLDDDEALAQNHYETKSEETELAVRPSLQGRRSDEPLQRLPSPWTAGPRVFEKSKTASRGRSASKGLNSGPTSMLSDLNVKRFVSSFNLPSLPKTPSLKDMGLPTISTVFGGRDEVPMQKTVIKSNRANTLLSNKSPWDLLESGTPGRRLSSTKRHGPPIELSERLGSGNDHSLSFVPSSKDDATLSSAASQEFLATSTHGSATYSLDRRPLRRATSDQSILLRRVTSTGSSLGDDTRWEHVQQQVNSRMQALKDSWQDSNLKLPSMPALPNINIASLRPEFFRPRGKSDPRTLTLNNGSNGFSSSRRDISDGPADGRQPLGQKAVTEPEARSSPKSMCPSFDKAVEELTGDLVVMGGYRGSVLRSANPPHQQLWVPIKVGLNIRKVDLEVGLTAEDEEEMHKKIIASGMLSHIGPIDMGRRLLRRLRSCANVQEGRLRIYDYGYDWRLSPHLLSQRLVEFLERLPCNRHGAPKSQRGAKVIAHSMGGLITRHAVNQRPTLFAGVVYAGVPQHCINILGPLRNGDDVLLSSKVLTAQVNFTLRTSFLLLPEEGHCFMNKTTKQEYTIDFFNPETWNTYSLSPCIAPALPPFTTPEEKKSILSTVYNTLPSFPAPLKRTAQPSTTEPPTSSLSSQATVNPSVQCTIPRPLALAYLARTLNAVKAFKRELAHLPEHDAKNVYPPVSIIYSTSVPTVYRARVLCKEAIRHADAYDDLQFASGDGVCLARAAMVPEGYQLCQGGKVRVDRGHVGLLGDLDGVGKCLVAIGKARQQGAGLGEEPKLP